MTSSPSTSSQAVSSIAKPAAWRLLGSALMLAAMVGVTLAAAVRPAAAAADSPSRPEEGEVERLYRSVLGRSPDGSGFAYWVSARVEGVSLRAVADGFLNSAEFARRFDAEADADFVDQTYRNVLGRPGDAEGAQYWVGELAAGLPRSELVLLLSESPENKTRTGTVPVDLPKYGAVVSSVSEADVARSWKPGCPVHPDDLRAVEVDYVDFAGSYQRGTLIVRAAVADDIAAVFERLYGARYPVESIRPIDVYDGDDAASMEANNTSAFNCRAVTGGTSWSRHSYGMAVDINPMQNPYVSSLQVLPPKGAEYVDRQNYHPAMIRPGDVVQTSFADIGWRWGGSFRSIRDYQHFDR